MKAAVLLTIGLLTAALSAAGAAWGARAAAAQWLYFQAKYGGARGGPAAVYARCERAQRLYSRNFLFCAWAAERAWEEYRAASAGAGAPALELARRWCDAGLRLNPYVTSLRMLKARLLALEAPAAGADYWRRYVEWDFWSAQNHAALVELCAAAGRPDLALESLRWVEGSAYEGEARRALSAAWRREAQPPAAR